MSCTKAEWLQMKATRNYAAEVFWEFFQAKNTGKQLTEEEFLRDFQKFVGHFGGIPPMANITEYFDHKFQVTKLLTKEGILIKEY